MRAGTPNEHYSLLTDNEHSLNAQFVMRGQRLNEATSHWFDLPTLEDKATWLGAIGLTYKDDSAEITRAADGQTIGESSHSFCPHVPMMIVQQITLARGA